MIYRILSRIISILSVTAFILPAATVQSQCNITAGINNISSDYIEICDGTSISLMSDGVCNYFMNNNFNNGQIGAGWATNCSPMFNNPCGAGSDGTTYLWIGSASTFPRDLVTAAFNVLAVGCEICFDLRFSIQGDGSPCEGPDEVDEGVELQYSTDNGATWNSIIYFRPDGQLFTNNQWIGQGTAAGSGSTPFTSWANYCFSVPPAAQTTHTMFRWHQEQVTDYDYDHWGLDNVNIYCPSNQAITWTANPPQTGFPFNGANTGSFTPPVGTNTYTATIVNISNPTYTSNDVVTVVVYPNPTSTFTAPSQICSGQNASIIYTGNAGPSANYQWNFGGGNVISGSGQGPYQISFPHVGTYNISLTVTGANPIGCSTSSGTTVNMYPVPVVNLGNDTSACYGQFITLDAGNQGINYLWSDNSTNTFLTTTVSGNYSVTVTNANQCSGSDNINITYLPLPTPSVSGLNPVCALSTETYITPANTSVSFSWTVSGGTIVAGNGTNQIDIEWDIGPVGSISLTEVNFTTQCSNSAIPLSVTINPLPVVNLPAIPDFCSYDPPYILNMATPPGGHYYLNGNNVTSITPSALGAGSYYIFYSYTDANGCTDTSGGNLQIFPSPVLNVNPQNIFLCYGDSVVLHAAGAPRYVWWPPGGLSDSSSSSPLARPLVSTTYTAIGYAGTSCSDTATVSVTVAPPLPSLNFPPVPDFCSAEAVYQLNTATPPGGTYYLNGLPATFIDPSALSPGDYHVTYKYTNSQGCFDTTGWDFSIFPSVIMSVSPLNATLCYGDSVALNASGAPQYFWSPRYGLSDSTSDHPMARPLVSTLYTVTGVNSFGCNDTASVAVTVYPQLPQLSLPQIPDFCTADGIFILNIATPPGGTYYLNGAPANHISPAALGPGNYHVTYLFTDTHGCFDTVGTNFSISPSPVLSVSPQNAYLCYGDSITISANGAPQYEWSPQTGLSDYTSPNPIAKPLTGTTYTLVGSNIYGCTDTARVTITVYPPLPSLNILPVPDFCSADPVYPLNNASPPGGEYYLNGSPVTSVNPAAAGAGGYHITYLYSDTHGCFDTIGTDFTIHTSPLVAIRPSNTSLCYGDSIRLVASGADTYSWSPGSGLSDDSSAAPMAQPLISTTYTVSGYFANGCFDTATVTVTVFPQLPQLTFNPLPDFCTSDPVYVLNNASPAGGSYYINGIVHTSIHPGQMGAGTYHVSYRFNAPSGCYDTTGGDFSIYTSPVLQINPTAVSLCYGDSVRLNVTGASGYSWYPSVGLSDSSLSAPMAKPSVSTTYTVVGSSQFGCRDTGFIHITVFPPLPRLNLPLIPDFCTADTAYPLNNGTPSGGVYTINGRQILFIDPAQLGPGFYHLIYRWEDQSGCFDTVSRDFSVYMTPVLSVNQRHVSLCYGESVTLNVSGADMYLWTPATGLDDATSANPQATPLSSNLYYVTGTTVHGCYDTATVDIIVNPLPVVNLPQIGDICSYHEIIPLNFATPHGGTYLLNNIPERQIIPGNLTPGLQTLTYTYLDSNQCSSSATITFNVFQQPAVSVAPGDTGICSGDSIVIYATGAVNYLWSPGSFISDPGSATVIAKPVQAITYSVIGNDLNQCADTATIHIFVSPRPVVDLGSDIYFCFNPTYEIHLELENDSYDIIWQDGSVSSNYLISKPGRYWVTVSNNECLQTDTLEVFQCPDIWAPTAFTPNGDRLNENFFIIASDSINFAYYHLYIYDRWGGLVFQSSDIYDKWNGELNGTSCPQAAYVWILRYGLKGARGVDIEFTKHGTVTLVR